MEEKSQKRVKGGRERLIASCGTTVEEGNNILNLSEVQGGDEKKGKLIPSSVTVVKLGGKMLCGLDL